MLFRDIVFRLALVFIPLLHQSRCTAQVGGVTDEQNAVLLADVQAVGMQVQTAFVRYQMIPLTKWASAVISHEEICDLMESLDDTSSDEIERCNLSLYSQELQERVRCAGGRFFGGQGQFQLDGVKSRRSGFNIRGEESTVEVFNGETFVRTLGFLNQVNVHPSASRAFRLSRIYPPFDKAFADRLRRCEPLPLHSNEGVIAFGFDGNGGRSMRWSFQWPSLELTEYVVSRGENVTSCTYYKRFVEIRSGHLIPTLVYRFQFGTDDMLLGGLIYLIEEIRVNEREAPLNLSVALQANDHIVDFRAPGKRRTYRPGSGDIWKILAERDK